MVEMLEMGACRDDCALGDKHAVGIYAIPQPLFIGVQRDHLHVPERKQAQGSGQRCVLVIVQNHHQGRAWGYGWTSL